MPILLIADDHPLFRAALRAAAADAVAGLQVREAESLDGVLAALEAEPGIDLVLLDLHMPGNHGLAGLAAIRAQHPGVAVVVVSANDDPRVIRRALDHVMKHRDKLWLTTPGEIATYCTGLPAGVVPGS